MENFTARGRPRWEVEHPQRAAAIREIVEPRTQADAELKSARRYTNLSAAEVLEALRVQKHDSAANFPCERSMRDILNRMNYRLKRIQICSAAEEVEGHGCDLRQCAGRA